MRNSEKWLVEGNKIKHNRKLKVVYNSSAGQKINCFYININEKLVKNFAWRTDIAYNYHS